MKKLLRSFFLVILVICLPSNAAALRSSSRDSDVRDNTRLNEQKSAVVGHRCRGRSNWSVMKDNEELGAAETSVRNNKRIMDSETGVRSNERLSEEETTLREGDYDAD